MALTPTYEEQILLKEAQIARASRLRYRERRGEALVGGGFVLACAALWLAYPPSAAAIDVWAALACVLGFSLAMRAPFGAGGGFTVPTQIVFVPLVFALPPALIGPAVALAVVAARVPDVLAGREPASRLALSPGNAWFALGPAIVLATAGIDRAEDAGWALLAAALAAQIALDVGASAAREALYGGASLREQVHELWVHAVDIGLTPVGLLAAVHIDEGPWAAVALLPLLGVLAVLAREREGHLHSVLELNNAYRGTALVLGDVVEFDDNYTGSHSRSVVEIALEVGHRLGLRDEDLRNLEFAALLHDVGKIAIPKAIINKPGTLDPDEWRVVKTHTVEGQRMLDRVGGFMGDVGRIVRSHHERWDGNGYPDGLAGEAIPLAARIIACCDTWHAMTSNRSYRTALPFDAAARELADVAGTQLDPEIVAIVLSIVAPGRVPAAQLAPARV
jgi:putative nucleotidyltransferase with HDIG domain